jgi:hypothetical protein
MTASDPQPCFICRRRDSGLGVTKGKEWRFYCADCGTDNAIKANAMSSREFDRAEQGAIERAGCCAGEYLDQIDKTDLSTLDENEWLEFCRRMIRGFGEEMRKSIANHEAPF